MDKIKNILSSVRFQQVAVAIILYALVEYGTIDNETAVAVCKVIYSVLGISVGIGTIDKFASSIGKK